MNNIFSKIALGTVQFGLNYGINNKDGIPTEDKIAEILRYAHNNNIRFLDTAYAYGKSEERIGSFLEMSKLAFRIISKAPKNSDSENLRKLFEESLMKLRNKDVYGYLLHDFENFYNDKKIVNQLLKLKEEGKVKKIGFSLYYPEELEILLNENIQFDMLQLPYNLADRKFEPYFEELKEKNVEVHIRSVFLQGLFFKSVNDLPPKLLSFKIFLEKLQNISSEIHKPMENISLNFVAQNKFIDKVVLGVDNIEQLKKNIAELDVPLTQVQLDYVSNELSKIKIDKDLLIPSNWN